MKTINLFNYVFDINGFLYFWGLISILNNYVHPKIIKYFSLLKSKIIFIIIILIINIISFYLQTIKFYQKNECSNEYLFDYELFTQFLFRKYNYLTITIIDGNILFHSSRHYYNKFINFIKSELQNQNIDFLTLYLNF